MKTAVVYARYSCDRQNEQSIDGQLRVCRDYAERNDIIIIDTYIDKAMSGTNDDREDFQRMLKDSDNKLWDYVLVYKLDRFSRNKYEMAIHRKRLKDNNTTLLSAMENIPEGPEGILLESLLEGMNQYYSEELSQKTKRGMNETRLKGNFIGGFVNYGYERDGQKLKINPDEAEILKQIFNDYANGKKTCEIARELNNSGLKNKGNPFLPSTINHFLRQEKYTGIYKVNGDTFDKIYPQIIDLDTYAIVKKRIDANKHGKHVDDVIYTLKGKVYCGFCGKPIVSYAGKSCTGNIIRYYKCRSIKERTNCKNKLIQKEVLENIVNKAIVKMLDNSKNLSTLVDKILEVHEKRVNQNTTLNALKFDLTQVNKSLANIMNAIEKGIITETTKIRLEELETKKHDLDAKIAIAKNKERLHITKEDIIRYFKYSLEQCPQTMIDLLVKEIKYYNDEIEIIFNYTKQKDSDDTPQTIKLFTEKISYKRKTKNQHEVLVKQDIQVKILI